MVSRAAFAICHWVFPRISAFDIRPSAESFQVLLVIRNAEGEVRRMEVRDWLKGASDNGRKPVEPIGFAGERFDEMSVRRWRERVVGADARR